MSRIERIAGLIRKEISGIIREDVSDPRIGFISITGVEISPDLENARIFVSILGNEDKKKECMHGLYSATRFIRGKLGNVLALRVVPAIQFVMDDSLERGGRVLGIMSSLSEASRPGKKNERNLQRNKKSIKKR